MSVFRGTALNNKKKKKKKKIKFTPYGENFFLIYYFIISTDIHEAKLIEDSIQFRKQH